MKFNSKKTKQIESTFSSKCIAHGCNLRGTISSGSGYTCFVHYCTDGSKWPQATEAIRENEFLFYAIAEVAKMSDFEWAKTGWDMMKAYFEHYPEFQPAESEKGHKPWYSNRIKDHLLHKAGGLSKPPMPRESLTMPSRKSNFNLSAKMLGANA